MLGWMDVLNDFKMQGGWIADKTINWFIGKFND